MRLYWQNVRGLASSLKCLRDLIEQEQPDIGVWTESWKKESKDEEAPTGGYNSISCHAPSTPHRSRQGGGVTIWSKKPLRLLTRVATADFQILVTMDADNRKLIGTYVRPALSAGAFQGFLDSLSRESRGEAMICGDFNARNTAWDHATNTHGKKLAAWASAHNFKIAAPPSPSCYPNSGGASCVDLLLHRSHRVETTRPVVLPGAWNQHSDHRLLYCEIIPRPNDSPTRIPPTILHKAEARAAARDHYETTLPASLDRIRNASTPAGLEEATAHLQDELLRPWQQWFTRRPQRFRPGWTHTLDKLARRRTTMTRNKKEPEEQLRNIDREIKRTFRRNKRRLLRRELAELTELSPARAASKLRQLADRSSAAPQVDPAAFTAHIAAQQTHDAHIQPASFKPDATFREDLRHALMAAKRKKAPGPEGLTIEMLQLIPDLAVELLLALWEQVGHLRHMPTLLRTGQLVPIYKKGDPATMSNYRPITLLSHVRKVISAAVDKGIRRTYAPHHR